LFIGTVKVNGGVSVDVDKGHGFHKSRVDQVNRAEAGIL
jgi:hypothetical protein